MEGAVFSVLEQTWKNIELIVVDDASDDSTPERLRQLSKDYPITVIHNPEPKGAAASRNIAIEYAHGEFVSGIDDDDRWMADRIELLMNTFEDGLSAVCSYDRMKYETRSITWKKKSVISVDDLLYYNMAGNQVLTKKEYIRTVGGYDETLPSAQDDDLWIRLAGEFGPVKTVAKPLQIVNMEQERERITTSEAQIEGYRACFEKHRSKMSDKQVKYREYRIKEASGKDIGWIELAMATPFKLLKKEITRKLFR